MMLCTTMKAALALVLIIAAASACADDTAKSISLRLGGKEIALDAGARERIAALSRERLSRCGPNTLQHPHNFGLAAAGVEQRWQRLLAGSRLHIVYAEPFVTESHLRGTLGVSEGLIGLEQPEFFVGPDFSRHGTAMVEHLQCEYLPALELACLPELAPHLPARYRETCAKLERGADGRIVMPPPDIAPSCS
jgi:hypothetical protein